MARWEQQGWGNHPSNLSRCAGVQGFFQVEDFPAGLSPDYLGGLPNKNGKHAYPSDGVRIEHIQSCLLFNGCPKLWRQFEVVVRTLIWSSKCFYKYGARGSNRPKGFFALAFKRWSDEVITPLTEWEFLPPPVRAAFQDRPVDKETGEELWEQEARCYWFMLDTLAQKLAKDERDHNIRQFLDEYSIASVRRLDWQV